MLDNLLQNLNDKQVEAVKAIDGPVLILAGAGSGKTKALTHRIAYMIQSGIRPENILAVTFTNKAAEEMRNRVYQLLATNYQRPVTGMWLGTFHSICARILRQDIEALDYGRNFVIYDADDQLSLIKSTMRELNIDTKRFNPKAMREKISRLKNELVDPEKFADSAKDYLEKTLAPIYVGYQIALKNSNSLDFDDLITLTIRLFQQFPNKLAKYQALFKYILVDEYQDTNHAQYKFINLLAEKHRNLFVIGDDFQSIYGFRQADIGNILDFEKDYPEVKTILLEQNYRSTQNILKAANSVIANNVDQKQKNLWTEKSAGHKIFLKELGDQRQESSYLLDTIEQEIEKGRRLNDFTVLYRTHAQSRAVEEEIISRGFPYRIVGGTKFYERREVKDILAYLRLAYNPADLVSFERIHNVPERGIGKISFEKLRLYLNSQSHIAKALANASEDSIFSRRQKENILGLSALLGTLAEKSQTLTVSELVSWLLKKIDYKNYIDDGTEEGEERWKNVREISTAARKYDEFPAPAGLSNFLEEVALIQETDKLSDKSDAINLMTLHSVKGLEFPVVFIIGLEDGIFPHLRSLFEPKELEEERRLCYVGITRAKEKLFLTFCRQRNIYGTGQFNPPSRFLFEIPEDVVEFSPLTDSYES